MSFGAWRARSTVAATLLLGFAVGAAAGMLGAPVIDRVLGLEVRGLGSQSGGQGLGASGSAGAVALVVPEEADGVSGMGGAGAGGKDQSVPPVGAPAGHAAAGPAGHDAANCQVCAKKAFEALGASPDEGGGKTIGGINAPASRGGRRGVTGPGSGAGK